MNAKNNHNVLCKECCYFLIPSSTGNNLIYSMIPRTMHTYKQGNKKGNEIIAVRASQYAS